MRIQSQQTTWVVLTKFCHCISFAIVVISHSEQICKLDIKYALSLITDHVGSTCAHHYPHTKFHHCGTYRALDSCFFLSSANQNRYANEVLNMCIWWWQTMWVVLVPITTHIPSFINDSVAHTKLWIFNFFVITLANQNRYANEVLNISIRWWQTTWVVLVPPTTHIPSFTKIGHCYF